MLSKNTINENLKNSVYQYTIICIFQNVKNISMETAASWTVDIVLVSKTAKNHLEFVRRVVTTIGMDRTAITVSTESFLNNACSCKSNAILEIAQNVCMYQQIKIIFKKIFLIGLITMERYPESRLNNYGTLCFFKKSSQIESLTNQSPCTYPGPAIRLSGVFTVAGQSRTQHFQQVCSHSFISF